MFSHDSLHPSIADDLTRIENNRRELLATSPYACRMQTAFDEFMLTQGDQNVPTYEREGVRGSFYIYAKSFQMWLYNAKSYKDIAPLLRTLMQDGWKIVPHEDDLGNESRFAKTTAGFKWRLTKNVRDGFDINLAISLDVLEASEANSDACVRVQVGEKVIEATTEPIYEVLCPGGATDAS